VHPNEYFDNKNLLGSKRSFRIELEEVGINNYSREIVRWLKEPGTKTGTNLQTLQLALSKPPVKREPLRKEISE
jgi:hypothetical protein